MQGMLTGHMCIRRYGLPGGANASRAAQLYERGAALRDSEALTNLAWMHAHGVGLPGGRHNATRALELYAQAIAAAHDSMSSAAPALAYGWTWGVARARHAWSGVGRAAAGLRQDALNLAVLAAALAGVLWLRRRRSRPGPGMGRWGGEGGRH
jgi:TPR repeat protein